MISQVLILGVWWVDLKSKIMETEILDRKFLHWNNTRLWRSSLCIGIYEEYKIFEGIHLFNSVPPSKYAPGINCSSYKSSYIEVQHSLWDIDVLGTALPGFRGCNPPWLRLSQSWDHKSLKRQSLSPWQVYHLCPLHPAWPWAWPVSQWRVRILKGGST